MVDLKIDGYICCEIGQNLKPAFVVELMRGKLLAQCTLLLGLFGECGAAQGICDGKVDGWVEGLGPPLEEVSW